MANNREISQFAGLVTVNDTTNKVSIASTLELSGGADLEVDGGNLTVNASSDPTIRLNNEDGSINADQVIGSLEFKANDGSSDGSQVTGSIESIAQAAFTGQGSPSHLIFKTNGVSGANALTERVRVSYQGNVGIGTTNAEENALKLVQGSGDNITNFNVRIGGYIHMDRNHARKPAFDVGMASGRPSITLSHAEDYGTVTDKVRLGVTGDSYLNGSGNVGIATDVPANTLSVAGDLRVEQENDASDYVTINEEGITQTGNSNLPYKYGGSVPGTTGSNQIIPVELANVGASAALYKIDAVYYGGNTGTSPIFESYHYLVRNGAAGPSGHLSSGLFGSSVTATESYDSGTSTFTITINSNSSTRGYGQARVVRLF